MKIIEEYPPNYAEIEKVFDLRGTHPVFAYGHKLYNPHGCAIAEHTMVHEEVHEKQQRGILGFMSVRAWWKRYLADPEFRLSQEIPAYQAQYAFVKKTASDRNTLSRFLVILAKDLSGQMYGNMLSFEKAMEVIKGRE